MKTINEITIKATKSSSAQNDYEEIQANLPKLSIKEQKEKLNELSNDKSDLQKFNQKGNPKINEIVDIFMISISEMNMDKVVKISLKDEYIEKLVRQNTRFPIFVKKGYKNQLRFDADIEPNRLHYVFSHEQIFANTNFIHFHKITEISCAFPLKKLIYKRKEFLNLIINASFNKKFSLRNTLTYFNVINGIYNQVTTYVKDYKSDALFEEEMNTCLKYYINILYATGWSNSQMNKYLLKKATISAGAKFNSSKSKKIIKPFINYFNINTEEMLLPVKEFTTFNEFFARKLKPGMRIIEKNGAICSPADSRVIAYQNIEEARGLWIKGKEFTAEKLCQTDFSCQAVAICRLAPQDYHRFHSPVQGKIERITFVQGEYFSVHPTALKHSDVLTDNTRVVILINSTHGYLFYVAVGAAMVGSIKLNVKVGDEVNPMDEMGYFEFGGSTIILLFKENIMINRKIYHNSVLGIETLVKVGNHLAD